MYALLDVQKKLIEGFGVVNQPAQPRRLSAETRILAARFISGEFGLAMQAVKVSPDQTSPAECSPDMAYAAAIQRIAESAPLRILPEEKLVGAATLLEATRHTTPLSKNMPSTSHTTIGFESALKTGYRGLRRRIEERMKRGDLDEKHLNFLEAMLRCLEAAGTWHKHHIEFLEERIRKTEGRQKKHYEEVLANLRNVPENQPTSFREAVQSLWFMWSFQRLCGNWSGIGRIDKMLGPYLLSDLEAGRITLDEARELLAHFWIKGCEWTGCGKFAPGSGDAQFYQNIVLGGVDEEGQAVVNEVTYLVLDVVEELHISDFPIAVRVGRNSPDKLLRRIAEVQRLGGGIVAIYNEDLIIRALQKFGYPLEEARNFANDGCWEIIIPGKTAFSYYPFDMLQVLQNAVGLGPESRERQFRDFEALYQDFLDELDTTIKSIHKTADEAFQPSRQDNQDKARNWNGHPAPLLSIFVEGCIEKASGYYNLGAHYSVKAIHAGGIPDTANSLFVIKKLVYDEKRLNLSEFVNILKRDWKGAETLRREIRRRFELYGNDNPEADAMVRRVYDDYVRIGSQVRERNGVLRPLGISTFGREIEFRPQRTATPFGARQGDILATNFAPTPGTDRKGPTAVIRSFCSMDFEKLTNGVPLELKILPNSVAGAEGLEALVSLMKAFIELGGVFLHIDVVDSRLLKEAQQHPEQFPNLSVRISGWSARFATLTRDWQDMIIQRTQQVL